jgi:hypothetical protein
MNKSKATEALQAIANPIIQAYKKNVEQGADKLSPSTCQPSTLQIPA